MTACAEPSGTNRSRVRVGNQQVEGRTGELTLGLAAAGSITPNSARPTPVISNEAVCLHRDECPTCYAISSPLVTAVSMLPVAWRNWSADAGC